MLLSESCQSENRDWRADGVDGDVVARDVLRERRKPMNLRLLALAQNQRNHPIARKEL